MDAEDRGGKLSLDDVITHNNWLALIDQLYDLVEHHQSAAVRFSFLFRPLPEWPAPWQELIARLARSLNARILPALDSNVGSPPARASLPDTLRRLRSGVLVSRTPVTLWVDAISLNCDGFSVDEEERFHDFMEHLRLALSLQDELWKRLQVVEALSQRIEQADIATALFDERLMPVLVNRKARELIEQDDVLQFRDRAIHASDRKEDLFSGALEKVAAYAPSAGFHRHWGNVGVSFAKLPHGQANEGLSPPSCIPRTGMPKGAHVMATFHPVRVAPITCGAVQRKEREQVLLQARYGLSDREAMVALNIARGASVKKIAFATGRSPETVRAQLRSVFCKVGVASQQALALSVSDYLQVERWRDSGGFGASPGSDIS